MRRWWSALYVEMWRSRHSDQKRFSDSDPLTGIPPSRHPFQVFFLGAAVLVGLQTALGTATPPSLKELLPHLFVLIWGWLLTAGGLFGIVASWVPDRITGLLMERIALVAIGGAQFAYATVVWRVAGSDGVATIFFQYAVSLASFWRVKHINLELYRLAQKTRKLHEILNERATGEGG